MRNVLIIGAGRSASSLIKYLLEKSESENLHLTIGDLSLELAQRKTLGHKNATPIALDIHDANQRQVEIQKADIVISMLPAHMHIEVAKDCIVYKKHMVTASYISDAMQALDEQAKKNGLVFMNEVGLDPGIDHMSAMKVLDEIREQGGKTILFESFCGGLVAPENDSNLWNYKFTWAPRNVVLAGQGGAAKFIQEGTYKYIPYNKLFRRTEFLEIDGFGRFEGYANRDSLKYKSIYNLDDALTLYRGTIRRVGYSKAWDMFVQLGMTDDSYVIDDSEKMSYRDFINLFLPYHASDSVEIKLRHQLKIDQDDVMWDKLVELDLFSSQKILGIKNATPAQALEKILTDSWTLQPHDKDMIVMYHKFGYELNGERKQIDATMVCIGDDQTYTAMAKTVGLPVAMATLQILNGNITTPGVQLPIKKEVYIPILKELEKYGVVFNEKEVPYKGYN
ncbi:saccharopine dehydrogenase NADP-binding domain-containing protein [Flavobacterium columnare]|uniref:Saccharopine reductase n=1 Tax=Flavobacterium columnare (strain ATCC 49512 / CIP 103533 / TG 44/87) TaxID=1041826 RepID=G8XAE7_FLACA|nr:saccharopine dehydrogenase C-terminal domain-containing protein [Flavobacterium columnare]AEW86618.1 saccharopine reductase [Flavobacterium columnare ATCC 49512]ANO47025.1 saccharopine reductase [Flavobacterium columnare]APT22277.1 saccharopine dehydrogenase [Flavobacterium columnare]MBF6652684.1 saccharopine dehydrogenase [Flavobacterium columnare]PTD14093.1 saccharopine dehydrogenase [Flavobacterium columnare]